MKTTSIGIMFAALIAGGCQSGSNSHDAGINGMARSCINTAADYISAFNSCQPVSCVSPSLYAVIASPPAGGPAPTHIYPPNNQWAWVSGHESLLTYARWQNQMCHSPGVTENILSFVGFGADAYSSDYDYYLSVMDLSADNSLFVPSFARWFLALEQQYQLKIPLELQKAVTVVTVKNKNNGTLSTPTSRFVDITGCSTLAARQCRDNLSGNSPGEGCDKPYHDAAVALSEMSGHTTAGCVAKYAEEFAANAQPSQVRALLNYCLDVNPCNSGVGFTYNPSYPAPGAAERQHYTTREFALTNKTLQAVNADTTQLAGKSGT